jgi:hypothetical protein
MKKIVISDLSADLSGHTFNMNDMDHIPIITELSCISMDETEFSCWQQDYQVISLVTNQIVETNLCAKQKMFQISFPLCILCFSCIGYNYFS